LTGCIGPRDQFAAADLLQPYRERERFGNNYRVGQLPRAPVDGGQAGERVIDLIGARRRPDISAIFSSCASR
jgi:hypothetical protein